MSKPNANEWLRTYVGQHINTMNYVPVKSSMHDEAAACVEAARAAGLTIQDIKDAAGGDVETFLLRMQNALTDAANERLMKDD